MRSVGLNTQKNLTDAVTSIGFFGFLKTFTTDLIYDEVLVFYIFT